MVSIAKIAIKLDSNLKKKKH